MSQERIERILDAAYLCFTRHGVRRTTMDDIATAAGMSRPAVYQYVRNKTDAFRRLADRLFGQTLAQARSGADEPGPLADRLDAILAPKLALTQRLFRDSPHAPELLGENIRLTADLDAGFSRAMTNLLTRTVRAAARRHEIVVRPPEAREFAELALALTRGLEADPTDERRARQRLRRGLALLVAGVATQPHTTTEPNPTKRAPAGFAAPTAAGQRRTTAATRPSTTAGRRPRAGPNTHSPKEYTP
jgi:TetR/AcrR family transcriptional regulator